MNITALIKIMKEANSVVLSKDDIKTGFSFSDSRYKSTGVSLEGGYYRKKDEDGTYNIYRPAPFEAMLRDILAYPRVTVSLKF